MTLNTINVFIPFHEDSPYIIDCIKSVRDSIGIRPIITLIDARNNKADVGKYQKLADRYCGAEGNSYHENMETALNLVTEDYFAFIDYDDLSHPHRFYSLINLLQEDKLVAFSRILKFKDTFAPQFKMERHGLFNRTIGGNELLSHLLSFSVSNKSFVAKSEVIEGGGLSWRNYSGSHSYADWWAFSNLYSNKGFEFIYTEDALYFQRIHKMQISRQEKFQLPSNDVVSTFNNFLKKNGALMELKENEVMKILMPRVVSQGYVNIETMKNFWGWSIEHSLKNGVEKRDLKYLKFRQDLSLNYNSAKVEVGIRLFKSMRLGRTNLLMK